MVVHRALPFSPPDEFKTAGNVHFSHSYIFNIASARRYSIRYFIYFVVNKYQRFWKRTNYIVDNKYNVTTFFLFDIIVFNVFILFSIY